MVRTGLLVIPVPNDDSGKVWLCGDSSVPSDDSGKGWLGGDSSSEW